LIDLPPGPISLPIFSGLILIVRRRGANSLISSRGLVDGLVHDVEDVHAALVGELQRFAHDLERQAGGLDVELDAGDALARAGDLEVHVAEVVLFALDVGEELILLLAVHDEADGDAGDGAGDRHAGIHQRERPAADGCHGAGAVGLENLADEADGVGEVFRAGQHGFQAALGEGTVADLAAAGAHDAAGLADGERREVVVQHELLAVLGEEVIDDLLVARGAERAGPGPASHRG
jgi:hypothetical protein